MTVDSLGDLYEAWGKPEKAAGFRVPPNEPAPAD